MPQAAATPQGVLLDPPRTPKLLDQFLDAARLHGHTDGWAEEAADWCRQFILFHGKRHPSAMGRVAPSEKDSFVYSEQKSLVAHLTFGTRCVRTKDGSRGAGESAGSSSRR